MKRTILSLTLVLFALSTYANTISVNFSGTGASLNPGDLAGLVDPADTGNALWADTYVPNWNNIPGTGGSGLSLNFSDSTPSATTLDFGFNGAGGAWAIGTPGVSGNDKMWNGYLDNTDASAALTFTFNGLVADPARGSYDVIVYFDGDNGGSWRASTYTIGATSFAGEASENTDWMKIGGQNELGYFQLPNPGPGGNAPFGTPPPGNPTNNSEGNYMLFSGLTGGSFTLDATAGPSANVPRAPVNGIQIVGLSTVPEPTSALLAASGLLILMARRRRRG